MLNLGVIGVGVVGTAIKTYFTNKEITVYSYDKFKEEEGSFEDCMATDILFLCLPTLFDGTEYNKKEIYVTCDALAEHNYKGLIVIKSTIEPGTTNILVQKYKSLRIIHNPEFLSADTAIKDFAEQKHIVIGGAHELTNILAEFYRVYFPVAEISEVTSVESESMKIFINNFYAVKIQFFNEVYLACKFNGADYENVRTLMIKNGWINPQHTQVPGKDGLLSYGGMCFPKDTSALLNYMRVNSVPHAVIEATVKEREIIRGVQVNLES